MKITSGILSLVIIFCLIISTGCAKPSPTCLELLTAIENCFDPKLPACKTTYKMSASSYSKEHVSVQLFSLLFYGEKRDQLYELSLVCDYVIRLADGQSGAEIHIFRVSHRSDMDVMEKMVRRRLDYIKSRSLYIYSPDDYEKYSSGAEVYAVGSFIFLLATPDNQKAIEAVSHLI